MPAVFPTLVRQRICILLYNNFLHPLSDTTSDTAGTGGLGMLAAVLTPWGLIAAIITAVVYKGKKHPMTDAGEESQDK